MTRLNGRPDSDAALLRRAVVLLDNVARGADVTQSSSALECLFAADALGELAGPPATTAGPDLSPGEVRLAVEEALRLLADLSPASFALPSVADAVDAVQRAHALATRP